MLVASYLQSPAFSLQSPASSLQLKQPLRNNQSQGYFATAAKLLPSSGSRQTVCFAPLKGAEALFFLHPVSTGFSQL